MHTPETSAGERTLVVILALHRSGSSVTTQVLSRLGMSLGPFPLLGANEGNPHGHYEALPILELNRELQERVFGFPDDLPQSAELLRRFCTTEGRWPEGLAIPDEFFTRARALIEPLVESGPVSGFKDPRTPLLWSFWERVLRGLPGVRVVPVFVVRTPHEVAMSLFERSRADLTYHDGLDAAAVHLQHLARIRAAWTGPSATVRYGVESYAQDLQRAAGMIGLPWNPAALAEAFDETCRHHAAVPVIHPAQRGFDAFCGVDRSGLAEEELCGIDAAARQREDFARSELREARHRWQELNDRHNAVLDDYHNALRDGVALRTELGHVTEHRDSLQQQFDALEAHWCVGPLLRLRRWFIHLFRQPPGATGTSEIAPRAAASRGRE